MLAALEATFFLVAYLLFSTAAALPGGTSTPAEAATTTVSCVRFHKTGFWDVDIDNGPDLPPECGPPLSFHADRNKSKLPGEICAIVGAYLFVVLALGTLLLTWGRRMRQSALGSNGTLEIEMVNSPKKQFGLDPSPVSPASTSRSWIKKGVSSLKSIGGNSTRTSKAGSNPASPGIASINSFDANVLQDDRDKAQKEMERLYAAVMAHDEAKHNSQNVSETEIAQSTAVPEQPQRPKMRVNIADTRLSIPAVPQTGNSQVSEPTSPRSPVRAIYPPDHAFPQNYPRSPTSPIVARVPLENDMYPASPPPKSPPRMTFPGNSPTEQSAPSSPRSILRRKGSQPSSPGSVKSTGSKTKRSVRHLRISQPIPQTEAEREERQPLTPRRYPDPGKPPQPPTPHTGGTLESTQSSDYQYESLDQPAPLPNPQPQRQPSNLTLPSNNSSTSVDGNGVGASKSGSSSSNALPLRAFQSSSITSPGPTRTTFLERRADPIGRGPMTGRTPRTGVAMTPYSPYMPFTPITPVTPRLMSKKERKELKKAQGKKVIIEEDAVQDKEEMWGM